MIKFNKAAVTAVAALSVAGLLGTTMIASADPLTNEQGKFTRHRTLTVRRHAAVVVAPAPAPAPAPVTGAAETIVAAPFTVLGGVFGGLGGPGGPRKGGVTAVRYENAGAEKDKIDEGWAMPVPVDMSGPIYVVENGDPTISPLSFIGAPIAAAGSIVQTPFTIIHAATGL